MESFFNKGNVFFLSPYLLNDTNLKNNVELGDTYTLAYHQAPSEINAGSYYSRTYSIILRYFSKIQISRLYS